MLEEGKRGQTYGDRRRTDSGGEYIMQYTDDVL